MRDHRPSRTAIAVAILRAAHQLVDSPLIFEDPLALQILRPYADKVRDAARKDRPQLFLRGRMLRLFAAVRSRFCEDELTKAMAPRSGAICSDGRRTRHIRLSESVSGIARLRGGSSRDATMETLAPRRFRYRGAARNCVRSCQFRTGFVTAETG